MTSLCWVLLITMTLSFSYVNCPFGFPLICKLPIPLPIFLLMRFHLSYRFLGNSFVFWVSIFCWLYMGWYKILPVCEWSFKLAYGILSICIFNFEVKIVHILCPVERFYFKVIKIFFYMAPFQIWFHNWVQDVLWIYSFIVKQEFTSIFLYS